MPGLRLFCTIVRSLERTGGIERAHDDGNGIRKPDMCRAMSKISLCDKPIETHWGSDAGRMRCHCTTADAPGSEER
eukprot:2894745-Prymnesium_polylepis.1